jgi:hypothetical protein
MLFNRIGRLDGRWNLGHLGPMDDSWSVPDAPAFYKEAIARGEVEVDFVKLEPVIDSMRKGVAVHPAIKGDVRAGVMISPTNAVGQGLEAAKQGEKVFCHVHGGYVYIMVELTRQRLCQRVPIVARAPAGDGQVDRFALL